MDSRRVKEQAHGLGFALCGIAPADASSHRRQVLEWVEAGRHGTMGWLAANLDLRLDPGKLLPGARSVICVADHIGAGKSEISDLRSQISAGRIARYAQVDDYHKVLKKRLHKLADALKREHPGESFRTSVDTAPLLERELHHRAGTGWVGKNTMLIHPSRGSHMLLGEVVTTLSLEPDKPEPDHCGSCTRCIDACPTSCITPYSIDASRCVSYLTIEHRAAIEPSLHAAMGDWLYGCDVCQEVCPYNAPGRGEVCDSPPPEYGPPRAATMDPMAVLGWSEEDRREAFTRSAMKRAKLKAMKRNALIVLGNTAMDRPGVVARIRQVAEDEAEDEMVRETAREVLGRMDHSTEEKTMAADERG